MSSGIVFQLNPRISIGDLSQSEFFEQEDIQIDFTLSSFLVPSPPNEGIAYEVKRVHPLPIKYEDGKVISVPSLAANEIRKDKIGIGKLDAGTYHIIVSCGTVYNAPIPHHLSGVPLLNPQDTDMTFITVKPRFNAKGL